MGCTGGGRGGTGRLARLPYDVWCARPFAVVRTGVVGGGIPLPPRPKSSDCWLRARSVLPIASFDIMRCSRPDPFFPPP